MNDNYKGDGGAEGFRLRMIAEQAVARMNSRMRRRIDEDACDGLVEAILKTGEPDKFLFRPEPYREAPPRWSLSGMIARTLCMGQRWRGSASKAADGGETLSTTHYNVKRSGAAGLVITLVVALLVGITDFGMPAEVGLQATRNLARPEIASGDILIVAKDDRSEKAFGSFPWPRRHDAALVDKLRLMGAKTISFEQSFANKSNDFDDNALAAAFDRAQGKVWLSRSYEFQGNGTLKAIDPTSLFREKTRQAYFHFRYNMFGYIENMYGSDLINYAPYPSQADILAGVKKNNDALKPDYAIDYKTIKTLSAVDIISGKIDPSLIRGKTVFIAVTSTAGAVFYPIMGQGQAPAAYSLVIAAETLKAGVVRDLGFLPAFLVSAVIGIACIMSRQRKRRAFTLVCGTTALILLVLIADRLRLHLEMVPALLALLILGVRESTRSKVIDAMTTNELTGLPNLSHLQFVKGYQDCTIVAIKIERYRHFIEQRPRDEQRILMRAIAARINIIAPECVVHQGDDGLFVFLVPPNSNIDVDPMPGQLRALFTQDFLTVHGFQRIGISVGINDDLDCPFGERRAVAIDRAEFSEFVTLQAVQ